MSEGFAGARDAPAVRAVWPTTEGEPGAGHRQARGLPDLGELRQTVRSARVVPRARATTG